jgi:DNA end-binding protein Ku
MQDAIAHACLCVRLSREHIIALEARGKGMLGVTLRYPYEVRKEDEYFDDIPEPKITKDMLDLATHIVETKTSEFDPKKFQDQYEDAVKELLKKKQAGEKIEVPKERKPANVVNLMEALRRSIDAEGGAKRKPAVRSVQHRNGAKKKASKPHTRQRRAS